MVQEERGGERDQKKPGVKDRTDGQTVHPAIAHPEEDGPCEVSDPWLSISRAPKDVQGSNPSSKRIVRLFLLHGCGRTMPGEQDGLLR
jgi:hypothetical protein